VLSVRVSPWVRQMGSSEQSGTALPSPSSDSAGQRFVLNGNQRRVYDILFEKMDLKIALMYQACLLVLDCVEHDEKLSLAAHALRETMCAIAEHHGVTWDEKRLHSQLNELKSAFKKVTPDLVSGRQLPGGTISDEGLPRFLSGFRVFAEWYGNDVGNRRKQAENLFKKLFPGEKPALYQNLADIWVGAYGFFTGVAHHRKRASKEEFIESLTVFEKCIGTIRLEAVEDTNAIDELIAKGQVDG